MVRTIGVVISVVLGGLATLAVAAGTTPRRWTVRGGMIEAQAVRAAMEAEAAEARALGLRSAAQGEAQMAPRGGAVSWSMALPIAADECVAVIAASEGRVRVGHVALQAEARAEDVIAHDAMTVGASGGGLVAQAQWCERAATTRRVVVTGDGVTSSRGDLQPHRLHWAVYRGAWRAVGGPLRLTRGRLRPESLEALGADLPLREGDALVPRARLGEPVPISFGGARLLPADATTYTALLVASARNENTSVNPRIDPTPVLGVPWPTGLPVNFADVRASTGVELSPAVHDPVVDLGLNDYRRVLAVVHRARLGAQCAGVALVRGRYGHRAQAEAMEADGSRRALREQDNVAFDDQCPVQGPTIYLAPWRDHDPWLLYALRPTPAT